MKKAASAKAKSTSASGKKASAKVKDLKPDKNPKGGLKIKMTDLIVSSAKTH